MTPPSLVGLLATSGVSLALLLPLGLAALRWARVAGGAGHVGVALVLAYTGLPPLVVAESRTGVPVVALASLASLLWLVRGARPPSPSGPRPEFVLPLVLGALAAWVGFSDVRAAPDGGMAFRVGFDVSDRTIYALVAEEIARALPPFVENPLFAGQRTAYSFFPSLLGLFMGRYGGGSFLDIYLVYMGAFAFVMLALVVDGLLAALGASRLARGLTTALVVLGGDLSWLFDTRNLTALERTSHFLVFHSFAAEALYYNPWMLGLPVLLGGLHLALLWLRDGNPRVLLLASLVLGCLWQTKIFAAAAVLAGAGTAALLVRNRRLAALATGIGLVVAPWVALSAVSGSGGRGVPLAFDPLLTVRYAVATIPGLQDLLGPAAGGRASYASLLALLPFFLVGAFGTRLAGLGRLLHHVRSREAFHVFVALAMAWAGLLGLLLVGRPVVTDGAQFLLVPLMLSWLYAGPSIAALLSKGIVARAAGLALVGAALVNPGRYVILKVAPGWTPANALDRRYLELPAPVVEACVWLRANSRPTDALLIGLRGDPGDFGGLKSIYVAALAGRRLVAAASDLGVAPELGSARRAAVDEVYTATDAARAEAVLDGLGARFVWEETRRPLQVRPPRLVLRYSSADVRILELVPRDAAGQRPRL